MQRHHRMIIMKPETCDARSMAQISHGVSLHQQYVLCYNNIHLRYMRLRRYAFEGKIATEVNRQRKHAYKNDCRMII